MNSTYIFEHVEQTNNTNQNQISLPQISLPKNDFDLWFVALFIGLLIVIRK